MLVSDTVIWWQLICPAKERIGDANCSYSHHLGDVNGCFNMVEGSRSVRGLRKLVRDTGREREVAL